MVIINGFLPQIASKTNSISKNISEYDVLQKLRGENIAEVIKALDLIINEDSTNTKYVNALLDLIRYQDDPIVNGKALLCLEMIKAGSQKGGNSFNIQQKELYSSIVNNSNISLSNGIMTISGNFNLNNKLALQDGTLAFDGKDWFVPSGQSAVIEGLKISDLKGNANNKYIFFDNKPHNKYSYVNIDLEKGVWAGGIGVNIIGITISGVELITDIVIPPEKIKLLNSAKSTLSTGKQTYANIPKPITINLIAPEELKIMPIGKNDAGIPVVIDNNELKQIGKDNVTDYETTFQFGSYNNLGIGYSKELVINSGNEYPLPSRPIGKPTDLEDIKAGTDVVGLNSGIVKQLEKDRTKKLTCDGSCYRTCHDKKDDDWSKKGWFRADDGEKHIIPSLNTGNAVKSMNLTIPQNKVPKDIYNSKIVMSIAGIEANSNVNHDFGAQPVSFSLLLKSFGLGGYLIKKADLNYDNILFNTDIQKRKANVFADLANNKYIKETVVKDETAIADYLYGPQTYYILGDLLPNSADEMILSDEYTNDEKNEIFSYLTKEHDKHNSQNSLKKHLESLHYGKIRALQVGNRIIIKNNAWTDINKLIKGIPEMSGNLSPYIEEELNGQFLFKKNAGELINNSTELAQSSKEKLLVLWEESLTFESVPVSDSKYGSHFSAKIKGKDGSYIELSELSDKINNLGSEGPKGAIISATLPESVFPMLQSGELSLSIDDEYSYYYTNDTNEIVGLTLEQYEKLPNSSSNPDDKVINLNGKKYPVQIKLSDAFAIDAFSILINKNNDLEHPKASLFSDDINIAVNEKDINKLESLIANGAQPDKAVTIATELGDLVFLSKVIVLTKNTANNYYDLMNAAEMAANKKNLSSLKMILDAGAFKMSREETISTNMLAQAIQDEASDIISILLDSKYFVASLDFNNATALNAAFSNNDLDMIKTLLSLGFEPDSINDFGRTTLSYAAEKGNIDAAKLLMNYGANPARKDKNGNSPYTYSTKMGFNNISDIFEEKQINFIDSNKLNSAMITKDEMNNIYNRYFASSTKLVDLINNEKAFIDRDDLYYSIAKIMDIPPWAPTSIDPYKSFQEQTKTNQAHIISQGNSISRERNIHNQSYKVTDGAKNIGDFFLREKTGDCDVLASSFAYQLKKFNLSEETILVAVLVQTDKKHIYVDPNGQTGHMTAIVKVEGQYYLTDQTNRNPWIPLGKERPSDEQLANITKAIIERAINADNSTILVTQIFRSAQEYWNYYQTPLLEE